MTLEVPAVLRSQIVAEFDPKIAVSEQETSRLAGDLLARAQADRRVLAASISRARSMRYRIADTSNGETRLTAVTEITPSWLQGWICPF